jgi:hypothetical protein
LVPGPALRAGCGRRGAPEDEANEVAAQVQDEDEIDGRVRLHFRKPVILDPGPMEFTAILVESSAPDSQTRGNEVMVADRQHQAEIAPGLGDVWVTEAGGSWVEHRSHGFRG